MALPFKTVEGSCFCHILLWATARDWQIQLRCMWKRIYRTLLRYVETLRCTAFMLSIIYKRTEGWERVTYAVWYRERAADSVLYITDHGVAVGVLPRVSLCYLNTMLLCFAEQDPEPNEIWGRRLFRDTHTVPSGGGMLSFYGLKIRRRK